MKRILGFLAGTILTLCVQAQKPVHWTCKVRKTAAKTYELHCMATIGAGWHIYSQVQPENAINIPVSIKFTANPLIAIDGVPKEIGKVKNVTDKTTGIPANEYEGKVEFVQIVQLKASVKTSLTGTISFQVCNEEMCLPPATEKFSLPLE